MPFPVTYLLDHIAPSETFIRRELDLLRRHNWPVFTRLLNGGVNPLKHALHSCPDGFGWAFCRAAAARGGEELAREPRTAGSILKHLPQTAYLLKKIQETDSRLIHAHFAGITADLASIAARTLGLPWTCAVHAHDVFTGSPQALLRRLRTAAGVVACSQMAADAVLAAGLPKEKVHVVRHGLPLNDYPFDRIQPDGALFTACRLDPKKGVDTLIEACALLLKRGVRFTCVIAGKGPLQADLEKQVAALGLEQTVYFTGWLSQEETRTRLMDATVLVLPSRRMKDGDRDGIANIVVEAMALGTPVITTTAGAAGEIITHDVNGLLAPSDQPDALADLIERALSSKELVQRLAKEARVTAETLFDGSKNIGALEQFFTQAVSRGPT
jgi:glycosyltransferase involved in cell wall biosynthesis